MNMLKIFFKFKTPRHCGPWYISGPLQPRVLRALNTAVNATVIEYSSHMLTLND